MATTYLHINGTNYPLSEHYSDRQTPQYQAVERQVRELVAGDGPGTVSIQAWIDGRQVDLWIRAEAVAVAAVFASDEPRSSV